LKSFLRHLAVQVHDARHALPDPVEKVLGGGHGPSRHHPGYGLANAGWPEHENPRCRANERAKQVIARRQLAPDPGRGEQFLAIWLWRQRRVLGRAFRPLLAQALVRQQKPVRFCVFGKLRQRFGIAFPIANIAPFGPVRFAEWPDNAQAGDMALETLGGIANIDFARLIGIRPQDNVEAAQELRMGGKPFARRGAAIPRDSNLAELSETIDLCLALDNPNPPAFPEID
jgi:hypothetical protein